MTQQCRYCCHLEVGGAIWCRERGERVSAAVAKSPNRCHSFAYSAVDAFGKGAGSGGRATRPGGKQCAGQMGLF